MNRLLFLILPTILISCGSKQNGNNSDHNHDEVKILITSYTNEFEFFAEADPFVVGNTSEIILHITKIESFKPLTSAGVKIEMVWQGGRTVKSTAELVKPGIFRLKLKPEEKGIAAIFFYLEHKGETVKINAGSYEVFTNGHAAMHAAEDMLPSHPSAVSFTKEQSWLIDFATEQVTKKQIGVVIKSLGEVTPARNGIFQLTATTQGIVRFVKPNLFEGTRVQKGDVFLTITGEALADGNTAIRFQEAKSNYEKASANYERLKPLAEEKIVSQRDFLDAKNQYENARASFESISANFSSVGQTLRSPISGHIAQIFVNSGQFVETGQPILTVANTNEVVIKLDVQQQYSHHLSKIKTINFLDLHGNTRTLESINGKVISYGRNTTEGSRLVPVFVSAALPEGWILGSLIDAYIVTSDATEKLVVPNTSLIEAQGNYFVFVQLHPESFAKRQVRIGVTDGINTEILGGLSEGERIVSIGAILVKMAAASASVDPHSGHMH